MAHRTYLPYNYVFPKMQDGSHCSWNYLKLYPWLRFSQTQNKVFCVYCVLFSTNQSRNCVRKGLQNYNQLTFLSKKHAKVDEGRKKFEHLKSEARQRVKGPKKLLMC